MLRFTDDCEEIDWSALKAALGADDFDNGRTPEEYRRAARNSRCNRFALDGDRIVGNARALSDGVCNAWLVDVWTASSHRRRGIASHLVRSILAELDGQHVALFTADHVAFYESLGFRREQAGMSQVVGTWLRPRRR
jgi:predicted GNAT family acetyltransferase